MRLMLAGVCSLFLIGCSPSSQTNAPLQKGKQTKTKTSISEWEYTNGMAWPSASRTEVVMQPGERIQASMPEGEIIIRAEEQYERFYTWEGATRSIKLLPREARWYGSLGLYFPGPGHHWKSHNGITRGVLQEGILWFKTTDDFLAWIGRNNWLDFTYNDSGLTIGWRKDLSRNQINVEVWQIMIDGQKPEQLPGSQNEKLTREKL